MGAMGQSIVVATSYSTLGMGAVAEAINQTGSPAILCNYKDVGRVAKLQASCPSLKVKTIDEGIFYFRFLLNIMPL